MTRGPVADPVATLLRASVRRSVRAGLGGVWLRGPLPPGGAVLAPNHHSWWDGYVMRELAWAVGADFRLLVVERQLAQYPFLRRVGALGASEVRAAVRAAQAGAWVTVFPEGTIQPAGPLRGLRPGAAWIARTAGAALVPIALRVGLRGGQAPEAYLRFGGALEGAVGASDLAEAITRELAALDADLTASDPEQPLAGYLRVSGRRARAPERPGPASRLLARLTERA